jgi:hypothetical protein
VLGTHLNRSGLYIRVGVLLYKQLIRPIMDYACRIWRGDTGSYVRMLQVHQSKCFWLATSAPWYISNGQVHDMGVLFFDEDITDLTER